MGNEIISIQNTEKVFKYPYFVEIHLYNIYMYIHDNMILVIMETSKFLLNKQLNNTRQLQPFFKNLDLVG